MESFENYGTYKGMLRKLTTIPSKRQEHALEMPRKCQGNTRNMQKRVEKYMEMRRWATQASGPCKTRRRSSKNMESFENNGTYVGMLNKHKTIQSKCQQHAWKMLWKCPGNAKKMLKKCQEMHGNATINSTGIQSLQNTRKGPWNVWNPKKMMGRI